jgi:phospholipase C
MMRRLPLVLAAVGLVLSAGCSSNGSDASVPAPRGASGRPVRQASGRPATSPISHVIVIVQENRSFENFFAGYPGANAPLTGCASPPPPGGTKFETVSSNCPSGDALVSLHQMTFENNPDLKHDWKSSLVDWNNGKMDGFTAYGTKMAKDIAYGYVDRKEIQPYWQLAQRYVLADEMFPTEFGGSFTAHLTLVAGTDDIKLPGRAEVNYPNAGGDCDSPPGNRTSYVQNKPYRRVHPHQGPRPCFAQFNTIAEVLDNAEISWRIYASKVNDTGLWEPFHAIQYVRYGPDWPANISAPSSNVLTDASDGQLASVSWVTPVADQSDHPQYLSDKGPSWVSSVVNAIGESKYWNSSAIILLWDDWGGFYDSAPPPQLDYRGLGIRVPCIIISPYAKRGYVSHVQYEFGSILRFIEETYGLPAGSIGSEAQGYTDERATSLDDAFNFSQQPRAFRPIATKYPESYFLHQPPSALNLPVDTE